MSSEMDETEAELPAGVDLLWGRRDRSRRGGPKPALTLERIVEAAIALADEGGLAALSMSRLAKKLGFTTMSLYRYVTSKNELLMLAFDAAVEAPPEAEPGEDWRQALERWARANLAFYRQRRWLLEVPVSGLPPGPNQLRWLDRGLAALDGTRLTEAEKPSCMLLLAMYVRSAAALLTDPARAAELAGESGAQPRAWGQTLRQLVDADRYPALSRSVNAGVFDEEPSDGDAGAEEEFEFGLCRVLDGIAVLEARGKSNVSGGSGGEA
jgi:AcrR family transcriptional regulator